MLSGQSITDVIASRIMEAGKLIKEERVKRQWSQAVLAKRIGISQPAIKKIEAGGTFKSKHLAKIAEVLSIPLSKLDPSLTQNLNQSNGSISGTAGTAANVGNQTLQTIPGEQLLGKNDLPVYAIAQGGRGAPVLSSEPFTIIGRPHILTGIREAYGVLVKGSSMAREYNEGDIAYIDPHRHPKSGDACVFQSQSDQGDVEAVIKYLARSPDASATLWYVEQTNPPRKFTLKKAEWQICHVAVGKQSGR